MKIETKYNEGDNVWWMYENKPVSSNIRAFKIDCTYHGGSGMWGSKSYPLIIEYLTGVREDKWIGENSLFRTKEELIKSL